MEPIENNPLPQVCQECEEVKEWGIELACYNCDYALERFKILDSSEKAIVE